MFILQLSCTFSVLLRYVKYLWIHPRCSLWSCVVPSPANQVLFDAQSQSWICPMVCRILFGIIGLERDLGCWICVPWCQAQASLAWLLSLGQRKENSVPHFKLIFLITKFTHLLRLVSKKILQFETDLRHSQRSFYLKSPTSPYPELHAKAYNVTWLGKNTHIYIYIYIKSTWFPCLLQPHFGQLHGFEARVVAAWLSDFTCELQLKLMDDPDLPLLSVCM